MTDMLFTFENPFHELLIWAVLTKRHSIAMTIWRYGEEGIAKVSSFFFFIHNSFNNRL